jgi:hypothetical protein
MVYMVPDAELMGFAVSSVERMMAAGPSKHFDVIVQHYPTDDGPIRMRIEGDDQPEAVKLAGKRRRAGDPDVLLNFILDTTERFPAAHYMLILWGHALSFDFGSASDPLTVLELASVLNDFTKRRSRPLDILGCDTCRMSKLETAAVLNNNVEVIVASEIGTPLTSWPYKEILEHLNERPHMSPQQFGSSIIDLYAKRYRPKDVSLSMLDMRHGSEVVLAFLALAEAILVAPSEADAVKLAMKRAKHDRVEPMIDLKEFCTNLLREKLDSPIRGAAANLVKLLDGSFIKIKHSDPKAPASGGVGIYAPQYLFDPAFRRARRFFSETPGANRPRTAPARPVVPHPALGDDEAAAIWSRVIDWLRDGRLPELAHAL